MVELFEPDLLVENGIGADPVFLIGSGEVEMKSGFEGDSADKDDPCIGCLPFDFPAEHESAVGIFEDDFRDRKIEVPGFQKFFRFRKSGNSGRAESDSFYVRFCQVTIVFFCHFFLVFLRFFRWTESFSYSPSSKTIFSFLGSCLFF